MELGVSGLGLSIIGFRVEGLGFRGFVPNLQALVC